MSEKNKVETKKTNKTLVNLLAGVVVALIATAASYNYWHGTNIRVTFHAESEKDIDYLAFYTADNSHWFNGKEMVKQMVEAGSNDVEIILPAEKVEHFRLDFGQYPGTVTIKDIKIIGDETIEINNFDKYTYYKVDSHRTNEDGSVTITSNEKSPYMIVNDEFDIYPGDDYDWLRMGLIAGGSFIVAFLLAMLINRKKK